MGHISVCKGCTEREIGCHSWCEKYLKQVEENAEKHHKIMEEKAKYSQYNEYARERNTKIKKKVKGRRGRKQ